MPKIYKPLKKQKIVSNSETMFPNLYKKKKVVYDDFSKIYLTNIKNFKEAEITEENYNNNINNENNINNNISRDGFISTANNPIINTNLHNITMKQQTINFGRDTIKNSFMYSFRDKFKKQQQTLYNSKPKNKVQSSPAVNCGTLYDINHANFDSEDKTLIMTNYVSIC